MTQRVYVIISLQTCGGTCLYTGAHIKPYTKLLNCFPITTQDHANASGFIFT